MFVEGGWTPPWEPPPRKPRLTPRQERVLIWIIAANAVLWFVAPIGGATLFQAVAALFRP
jgi:hypothetical protein